MPWHFSSLLFLTVISSVGSQHLPIAVKNVAVFPIEKYDAYIWWPCYEQGGSYKIQFSNLDDGSTRSVIRSRYSSRAEGVGEQCVASIDLKANMTYKLNIISINEQGEGPPSPDVFYRTDPDQYIEFDYDHDDDMHPDPPRHFHVSWNSENRVKVTWTRVTRRRAWREELSRVTHPIEYTVHYADTKNLSSWNTVKTNNTWLMMDNLKNGTVYNAYVTATELNLTSHNSEVIALSIDEDMTGLPEPVITVEPFYKNGVASWKSVNCTLPPNYSTRDLRFELTVGSNVIQSNENEPWVHFETDKDIKTANCTVTHHPDHPYRGYPSPFSSRTSTWTENAKRKEEDQIIVPSAKYQALPAQIKSVRVQSEAKNNLSISWYSFESDITSFKIQVVSLHDGSTTLIPRRRDEKDFKFGMQPNGIYKVNVVAVNEQGEGPQSPDVYFHNRLGLWPEEDPESNKQIECDEKDPLYMVCLLNNMAKSWKEMLAPKAPSFLRVPSHSENQAKITWSQYSFGRVADEKNPIEYTIHYADTKNISDWKTIKTNETWIMMENLKKGTIYNLYVATKEGNTTYPESETIPLLANDDMSGQPEPVITLEPSSKNGVFTAGDQIKVKCTIPPNTDMHLLTFKLTVGSHEVESSSEKWVYINTTVEELVNTATCQINHQSFYPTTSTRTWKVLPKSGDKKKQKMANVDFRR